MAWDQTQSKWKPITVDQEVLNLFNAYCTTATITLVNVGGFIPLFTSVAGYVIENLGDAFTVISSTTLRFNRAGRYALNMAWQPSTNRSNLRVYINGILRIYSPRGEANPSASINTVLAISANDLMTVNNDEGAAENAVNLCWFLREIILNKKVVNSIVNTGTSLELLSDTSIIAKQNNDILVYNSTSGFWENKQAGYTPSYWRTYTLNTTASGV